jgi:hypothetical protein
MTDWSKAELPAGQDILSGMVCDMNGALLPVTLRAASADEFFLMVMRNYARKEGLERMRSVVNYLEKNP